MGGAEVAASAAAALSAASLALRPGNATFADAALAREGQLMLLAQQLRTATNASHCAAMGCTEALPPGRQAGSSLAGGGLLWCAFPTTSVDDDLACGQAWLWRATCVLVRSTGHTGVRLRRGACGACVSPVCQLPVCETKNPAAPRLPTRSEPAPRRDRPDPARPALARTQPTAQRGSAGAAGAVVRPDPAAHRGSESRKERRV